MPLPERLISSDDHVDLEHEHIKSFLASKYHGDYDDAVGRFQARMAKSMSSQANTRWREQAGTADGTELDPLLGFEGRSYPSAGRPGHFDSKARLQDMDQDGIEASVLYCEVSAFRYLYMLENGTPEATRAFNLALQEFASADPSRLIMSSQIPIHDIEVAVKEVQWWAEQGGKSIQLPVFPAELGLPDYWDERYDPLWAVIQEADLPVCCHIGLNTQFDDLAQRDPTPQKGIAVPMAPLSSAEALGMAVMGGIFVKFPRLKFVFVEPGLTWVAWWLDAVDDLVLRQGYEYPAISELPSHYFHQNVFLTFIDEPHGYRAAKETLGVDNVMWSSDYPHPVSSWPRSHAVVEEMLGDAPAEDREKIVCKNAERVWNL